MQAALAAARQAAGRGEVPVGAVITGPDGALLAVAGNETEARQDSTAHAEMLVIAAAQARMGSKYLAKCDLWVTLEPCAMCAGAIALARIRRLYYGASDPKGGAVEHGPRLFSQPTIHHRPDIYGGLSEAEASQLLQDFFAARRG